MIFGKDRRVKRLHPYCLDLSGQSLSSWFSPLNPKDQPKPNAQWQDGMSAVSTQREGRRLASGRGVMAKGAGVMAPTCNRPLR
jgi:hypothetical protein